jgi:DNA polymerase III subunit delta
MLYVFHGDDEFTRSEEVAKLKSKLGDVTVVSLNTTILDGRKLTLAALIQTCDTSPFLSERRLVIVEEFWSRFDPQERRRADGRQGKTSAADMDLVKGLLEYLPRLPDATRLLFTENRSLTTANPVHGILAPDPSNVIVREFRTPKGDDLDRWIIRRTQTKGAEIALQAAHELALRVGSDLRQLDQELDKLIAHVNYQGEVSLAVVRGLVSVTQAPVVFALVDAMGLRQGDKALRHLHGLLESGAAPPYLLSMIERQFRTLLQVRELMAQGQTAPQIQKVLGIGHSFIVEKSMRQALHFSQARLEFIHRHLAEVEYSIKSGELGDVLALDLLVVETCGRG